MEGQCKNVEGVDDLISNVRELGNRLRKRKFEAIDKTVNSTEAQKKAKHFLSRIFIIANKFANGDILPPESVRQALADASGAGDAATQTDAVDAATQADAVDAATQADAVDAATQADAVADAQILDADILDADILDADILDADILDLLVD